MEQQSEKGNVHSIHNHKQTKTQNRGRTKLALANARKTKPWFKPMTDERLNWSFFLGEIRTRLYCWIYHRFCTLDCTHRHTKIVHSLSSDKIHRRIRCLSSALQPQRQHGARNYDWSKDGNTHHDGDVSHMRTSLTEMLQSSSSTQTGSVESSCDSGVNSSLKGFSRSPSRLSCVSESSSTSFCGDRVVTVCSSVAGDISMSLVTSAATSSVGDFDGFARSSRITCKQTHSEANFTKVHS